MASRATPHRVVVVGASFAGLTAAKALSGPDIALTVIDRCNHHLFQPLLYQVATAGLSPAEIATPIRGALSGQSNARVILGLVSGIDTAAREVEVGRNRIPYDSLILATGARHSYFGHDAWERFAPGLKTIEDATAIRHRILLAFERAEIATDPAERRRLLNFVVIGGGPTGVELASAIAELVRTALTKDFRSIDPRDARVTLVEAGPRVLSAFDDVLSARAAAALERLGVRVCLGCMVTDCDTGGVTIGNGRIEAATVVWAAGVMASPAAVWLDVARDRSGRIIAGPDLTVPGYPEIFAIGDTASVPGPDAKPLPGLAPVAKQQGAHAARAILARLKGRSVTPFRYRSWGTMATIGRASAVAQFGPVRISGLPAWLLWGLVHIAFLIGFRNRVAVLLDWLWAYLTFRRGARLIAASTP